MNPLDREYWHKFYARELPQEEYDRLKKINEQWVLKTPYGPMVHRDTGKTYWDTNVELEHETNV